MPTRLKSKTSRRPIMAVIVLYQRAPNESQSFCSLIRVIEANPHFADLLSLVLYDNSPERHQFLTVKDFPILYEHDPTNAGLATAFNFALAHAEEQQSDWLLLLDQDTSPTSDFFDELAECADRLLARTQVASIVPKLLAGGKVISPEEHFIDQLRHQYRRSAHWKDRKSFGIQQGRVSAYNSGATFRISALRTIGGFPGKFWLDFLDHAVFHALSSRGFQMYVMRSVIEHDMSQSNVSGVPAWRQRNILSAQTIFVEQTGNFFDRLLYRIWVLRYSRTLWLNHPDRSLWKEALCQAFFRRLKKTAPDKRVRETLG